MRGKIRDLIRASTGEGFGQVPKNSGIRASTEKWWNPGEYQKRVKFGLVPEKGPGKYRRKVRASTEKAPGEYWRRVRASTEKAPGEYQRRVRASTGNE